MSYCTFLNHYLPLHIRYNVLFSFQIFLFTIYCTQLLFTLSQALLCHYASGTVLLVFIISLSTTIYWIQRPMFLSNIPVCYIYGGQCSICLSHTMDLLFSTQRFKTKEERLLNIGFCRSNVPVYRASISHTLVLLNPRIQKQKRNAFEISDSVVLMFSFTALQYHTLLSFPARTPLNYRMGRRHLIDTPRLPAQHLNK